jgi:RNA-directed DNA polymerase
MQLQKFYLIVKSDEEEIGKIIGHIDDFYTERKEYKKDKLGNIRLKNGQPQFRFIRPSKGRLKAIQSLIYKKILSKIGLPEYVMGGVKSRSSIQNAAKHKGKKYKFQTDLKSFFDTVSHDSVFKTLISRGFGSQVAHLITKLTTYKGCLPQGASTSPALANLVFLSVDAEIQAICETRNITYTRYVDDLTFSSHFDFKDLTSRFLEIIMTKGFKISHNKTNYKSKTVVTGVLVSQNKIEVTPEFLTKMNNPLNSPEERKGYEEYFSQVQKANKKK